MTPWPQMMKAALALGVPPEAFWRLSLKEWRMLTATSAAPMDRAALDALMETWPDDGCVST